EERHRPIRFSSFLAGITTVISSPEGGGLEWVRVNSGCPFSSTTLRRKMRIHTTPIMASIPASTAGNRPAIFPCCLACLDYFDLCYSYYYGRFRAFWRVYIILIIR